MPNRHRIPGSGRHMQTYIPTCSTSNKGSLLRPRIPGRGNCNFCIRRTFPRKSKLYTVDAHWWHFVGPLWFKSCILVSLIIPTGWLGSKHQQINSRQETYSSAHTSVSCTPSTCSWQEPTPTLYTSVSCTHSTCTWQEPTPTAQS